MIRANNNTPEGDGPPEGGHPDDGPSHAPRTSRKPRGVPEATAGGTGQEPAFLNPAQVAELWGISHDKVLAFIRSGELEAFNVASRRSSRPQFKIPRAALQAFQERRSGRDPARATPPAPRRAARKSSSQGHEYF